MKKNFGSAIVKKAITIAMAIMLIVTPTATSVYAAEANVSTETVISSSDEEAKEYFKSNDFTTEGLNEEEKALTYKIATEINPFEKDYSNPDASIKSAEEIKETAISNVDHAVNAAADASQLAADVVTSAVKEVEAHVANIEKDVNEYNDILNHITNNDSDIVGDESVVKIEYIEENRDNANPTPNDNAADIIVKVTDADGNTTNASLVEYTEEKANIANDAAKAAELVANNINAKTDLDEAAKVIEQAKADAVKAVEDATNAKVAAEKALDKEIAIYNAYVKAFYSEEDAKAMYQTGSNGEIIFATEGIEDLMSKAEIDSQIDIQDTLDKQKQVIVSAQRLVDDCELFTDVNGRDLVQQITDAQTRYIEGLTRLVKESEAALKGVEAEGFTDSKEFEALKEQLAVSKAALEHAIASANESLDCYSSNNELSDFDKGCIDSLSSFVDASQEAITNFNPTDEELQASLAGALTGVHDGAQGILNWYHTYIIEQFGSSPEGTINYCVKLTNEMIDKLVGETENKFDGIIGDANRKLVDAEKDYLAAKKTYDNLLQQYNTANIIEKFTTLKIKIEAAKQDLLAAEENVNVAVKDLEIVKDAEEKVTEEIKKLNESVPSTPGTTPSTPNSGNTDSSTPTQNTSKTSTPDDKDKTPILTSIDDEATALTSTPDEKEPIKTADGDTTLLDSVPKTGDNSLPTALPLVSGLITMAGGVFINLKKRFEK